MTFHEQIQEGIPSVLPQPKPYDPEINHAPKRKEILSAEEKKLKIILGNYLLKDLLKSLIKKLI